MNLRVHGLWPGTRVNGPGLRFLIHLQGCSRRCPGCFNPDTHDPAGGREMTVEDLIQEISGAVELASPRPGAPAMEGITISGGEPLEQAEALAAFLEDLRRNEPDLSALIYSGFRRDEIARTPAGRRVLELADVLIDGPFVESLATDDGVRGSTNQVLHFLSDRYGPEDFPARPESFEVRIQRDGTVAVTGFPPPKVRAAIAGQVRG